jgi:DNA polymerase I-like protein with 3'-5' exonuclease and polymerase domains
MESLPEKDPTTSKGGSGVEVPEWVTLEHQVAEILTKQQLHGWYFDERSAHELECELRSALDSLQESLRQRHPFVEGGEFTPRRPNSTRGYFTDGTFTRIKDLNPTSRDHIAWVLSTACDENEVPIYGWKPNQFTDKGKATIDEVVLNDIGTPIALDFLQCLELSKQLGMLSDGNNAWLKLVRKGRIHHHCSVATNTHRCAHRNPNLAQVPSDERFRRLFTATPGLCMVGADLSGIELRMFAHYLSRYDGGRYGEILLNGDIHQVNADKIGVSRRIIKTISYAFLYGAGNEKLGLSYDPQLPADKAKKKGAEIRQAYLDAIEGLSDLVEAVKKKVQSAKYVTSVDGRRIAVDGPHKALNYLLQSGAGVIAKRWMVIANDQIKQLNIEADQLAFVHDELQFECNPAHADTLMFNLELAAAQAGEYYGLRIPIAAEAGTGSTWADTH